MRVYPHMSSETQNRSKNFELLRKINGCGVISIRTQLFSESTESNIALEYRELTDVEAQVIEEVFDLEKGWFDVRNDAHLKRLRSYSSQDTEFLRVINLLPEHAKKHLAAFIKSFK